MKLDKNVHKRKKKHQSLEQHKSLFTRRSIISGITATLTSLKCQAFISRSEIGARNIVLDGTDTERWEPEEGSSIFISQDAVIDIGVNPTPDMFFRFEGAVYSGFCGCISKQYIRLHWGGYNRIIQYQNTTYTFTDSPYYPANDGVWWLDAAAETIYYYGKEYPVTTNPSFLNPTSLSFGARHFDDHYDYFGEALVRRITCGRGGVITNDFFPRVMDDVVGLYDVIGRRFFSNISSGEVTYHLDSEGQS